MTITDHSKIFIVVDGQRMSLADMAAMDPSTIKRVYASGCTALTELKADAAEHVYASGCTALTEFVPGGEDSRGCFFFGFPIRGHYRIFAGSRNFNVLEAREYWGKAGAGNRPDCLALVEKIAAEIERRGALVAGAGAA